MSNQKKPRRRYFRRRKKGAKAEELAAPSAPKPKSKSRRRGGRRARSRRERELPIAVEPVEEVLPEPETSSDEAVSVFVYTYVVRPQFRDAYSDYRSEHSLGEGHYETAHTRIMAQVTGEIQARVETHFDQVESEGDTWKRPLSEFRQARSGRRDDDTDEEA